MGSIKYFKRFLSSFKSFSTLSPLPINKPKPKIRPDIVRLDYDDKIFRDTLLQVKSRKTRMESGMILIEGMRLLKDILKIDKKPLMIFFTRTEDVESLKLDPEIKLYKVPYNDMKIWSDVVTPQGIMAIFQKPEIIPKPDSLPLTLICDQIRDPGNLGTILRISAGVGVKKIQLTKGCVDPWEPKVLRSGSGAHFKIPIETNINWNDITKKFTNSSLFSLATNRINSKSNIESEIPLKPYFSIDYNKFSNIFIVIGGETEGLSENVFQIARQFNGIRINIPLNNDIESLNAASAASVILFEVKKQLSNNSTF